MTSPSVFISYSHDSTEHKDRILALSERLRHEGVDCTIDQYEQSPAEGWPLWCQKQVKRASFVLVVCTETYLRRFDGEEAPRIGLGVTWEGHIVTQELFNAQGKNTKYIPVTFRREDFGFIPLTLQGASHYEVFKDYELLYRLLTGQPQIIKSKLGAMVSMAPRLAAQPSLERKADFEPKFWLMRHGRSKFFTGRESVLCDLREALEKRRAAALSGLGGVGKTQTAIEFAYRHRQQYKAVFWVDAESRETLLGGFVAIAGLLNLSSAQAKEQESAIAEVHGWLESNPGWLLILDNADDLPVVQGFLPSQENGHLLLTTQAQATAELAESIPVEGMLPEDGALLLLRRAGAIGKETLLSDAGETDRRVALELSKELGGLPLALDQAGAFIQEGQISVSEYAELYQSESANLLAERGTLSKHGSVTVTFSLAFKKLERNSAAAADLIRLCAFLAPDAIPEEIFTGGDESVLGESLGPAVMNKLSFARLIREAGRFSLLERDATKQTLNVHRLVQIVVKAGMSETERRSWAERAVRAMNGAFPDVEFANWGLCQRLITHAQTCASLIEEWELHFVDAARLLDQAAFYLGERALFGEAEPLYHRSLAIYENALEPDHPDVGVSLNDIADLYLAQGRYAEAEPLYERSLAIWEKALGPDHVYAARSLNSLAVLYKSQGRYTEAEPVYQRSLATYEKVLGPNHPHVATSLNNLAELFRAQGKYADAEPLYQRSLAIWEKALGPEHPNVASALNNKAALYDDQEKYAEAEPLYERSLAIWVKALGPEHPNVATALNNLAVLYDNQGKYAEAEPLFERSLAIQENALGADHPYVAQSLNNLAGLYEKQGRDAEAEPLRQRARAIEAKASPTGA